MMTFDAVRDTLSKHLGDSTTFQEWFARTTSTLKGQRLAICLAIELETGSVLATDVSAIIKPMCLTAGDIGGSFVAAVDAHPETKRLRFVSPQTALIGDRYVRVLQLSSFVNRYLSLDFEYSLDFTDLDEVRQSFFPIGLLDPDDGDPLDYVRSYWSGKYDVVWVAPLAEVMAAAQDGVSCPACAVNDALGLGFHGTPTPPFLVAVKYPPNCMLNCGKPTVYVADWNSDEAYYLSSSTPLDWGLTESCTGKHKGRRERIHHGIPGLGGDYKAVAVGAVEPIVGDFARLVLEGLKRLELCLSTN